MSDKPTVEEGDSRDPSGQSEKRAQRRRPVLKIVLDTNQLFTGSASDLLQLALRQVIEASRTHRDIEIEWHVPEVVRSEREYQMTDAAIELLPTITKLERLLGHNLGINTDILASRVRDAIERQVTELGLKILPPNMKDIDWQCIVRDAIFRKPPFEKGKTEKGFRDRLIAESFLQLVRISPRTPSVCRVALVTNDGLLATTVETETKTLDNVRIVKSLEDLQDLINTLVSSATEEFVAAVRQPAMELFFKEGSKDGLYYTEKVREAIVGKFDASLAEKPANADLRENGTWYIGPASFVEKHGQKITWKTTIRVEATAYKLEQRGQVFPPIGIPDLPISRFLSPPPSNLVIGRPPAPPPLGSGSGSSYRTFLGATSPEKIQIAKGHSVFHVTWTVTITSNRKLINGKVVNVEFAETTWE